MQLSIVDTILLKVQISGFDSILRWQHVGLGRQYMCGPKTKLVTKVKNPWDIKGKGQIEFKIVLGTGSKLLWLMSIFATAKLLL